MTAKSTSANLPVPMPWHLRLAYLAARKAEYVHQLSDRQQPRRRAKGRGR